MRIYLPCLLSPAEVVQLNTLPCEREGRSEITVQVISQGEGRPRTRCVQTPSPRTNLLNADSFSTLPFAREGKIKLHDRRGERLR